jgi:hypothetical protein
LSLCFIFKWAPHHEGILEEWRYSSTHSLTFTLDGGEWLASRPGRFTPRERAPGTHWIRGWVGSGEEKNSQPLPKLKSLIILPRAQHYVTELTWLQIYLLWLLLHEFQNLYTEYHNYWQALIPKLHTSNIQGIRPHLTVTNQNCIHEEEINSRFNSGTVKLC